MKFTETELKGAYVVTLEPFVDDRGSFARAFCREEFQDHGLEADFVQANNTVSTHRGVIRGLHYQVEPSAEVKFIRCIRGAVWDVILDMRPDSPTYLQHFGIELTAENRTALYIPRMFAHGYQARTDGAETLYFSGSYYAPDCERGVCFDDPTAGIDWPAPPVGITAKDRSWPPLSQLTEPSA